MPTTRRSGFDRGGTTPPVNPPGMDGDGDRYNLIILQKTNVTLLPTSMVPAPYTRGFTYMFGGEPSYRFIDDNNNASEVLTEDITNADATMRIATITRT